MPITKNKTTTNKKSPPRPGRAKSVSKKSGKKSTGIQLPRRVSSRLPLIIIVLLFGLFGALSILYSSASTQLIEKAQGKIATASSVQANKYAAKKANDGATSTRWASQRDTNEQWWQVDLSTLTPISKVDVTWDGAYASHYLVQGSTDGKIFTTLADVTNGSSGLKSTAFPEVSVRFVRIHNLNPGTKWGYSIREVQVYGTDPTVVATPTPTPTPEPTPTPVPTPPSSQKPDATNTGVLAGTTLRSISQAYPDAVAKGYSVNAQGRVTITKDGGMYENVWFPAGVAVKAKNITIRNSLVSGGRSSFANMVPEPTSWEVCRNIVTQGISTGGGQLLDANSSIVSNLLIEDTEIKINPNEYSAFINNYMGHDTTMRRVNIHGGVDAIGTHNAYAATANFTIEDSYIHDLYKGQWSPGNYNIMPGTTTRMYCGYDAAHPEGNHSDGIQMHDGSNVNIYRNSFIVNAVSTVATNSNAGIMMNGAGNVHVLNNHFKYGVCSLNMPAGLVLPIEVANNTFYGNNGFTSSAGQNDNGCAIIRSSTAGYIFSNNLWEIGTPIRLING